MSYDDGDVSMASFRDESFNMSLDDDSIDIVWHSTQPPAIRTILKESKCQYRFICSLRGPFPIRIRSPFASILDT